MKGCQRCGGGGPALRVRGAGPCCSTPAQSDEVELLQAPAQDAADQSTLAPAEQRSTFDAAVKAQQKKGADLYAGAKALHGAAGLHPQMWGISKQQLREFGELVRRNMDSKKIRAPTDQASRSRFYDKEIGPSMHQVNADFLTPLTKRDRDLPGASYAVLQNRDTCGLRCSLFISHCWDEGIFEFIGNALKEWPDECEGAYICTFSNPQVQSVLAGVGLGRGDIAASPFYRVLSEEPRPRRMLMLPNSCTPIYTRLWCVLEAHLAIEKKLDVRLAGNAAQLLSTDSTILMRERADVAGECREKYTQQLHDTTVDAETRQALVKKLEANKAAQDEAKLELLLKPDAELVNLARASATRREDEQAIRKFIEGKEQAIEALVAKHIRDHVCGVRPDEEKAPVPGPLGSLSTRDERLELKGEDLRQPARLLQLAKWMRMQPAVVHLKLNGCHLDDTSARLFETSNDLPALKSLDLCDNDITKFAVERLKDVYGKDVRVRAEDSDRAKKQFLQLAVQSSACVVNGRPAQRAVLISQLDDVCSKLTEACAKPESQLPICLSEGEKPHLAVTVRNGESHVLVWIASGHGWELPNSNPVRTAFDELVQAVHDSPQPPEMVVVCLKYGPRSAAAQLHAAGVPLVVWLRAALGEELELADLFFGAIEPTIRDAHRAGLMADEFREQVRKHVGEIATEFDVIGRAGALQWSNAPDAKREVMNECLQLLEGTNLTLKHNATAVSDSGALWACDVSKASELKRHLEKGTAKRLVVFWPKEAADGAMRCHSVAHEACYSYVQARGKYELIWRVSTREELAEADRRVASSRDPRVLLWFHLIPSGLSADEVISRLQRAHSKTHVLLTCDGEMREALDDIRDEAFVDLELASASDGARGVLADSLHQELRLTAELDGVPTSLLQIFSAETLRQALEAKLPGVDRPIAALYEDDAKEHSDDDANRGGALIVRMHVSDVGLLHEQRDDLLTGVFEVELTKCLLEKERLHGAGNRPTAGMLEVQVDRTQFAEQYEKGVLELENLTPHQSAKRIECHGQQSVHIMAPAGAGKTYIAMHEMLDLLDDDEGGYVLFVARNPPLCYFAARWLCARWAAREVKKSRRKMLLSRLHVLFEPLERCPRVCTLEGDHIETSGAAEPVHYAMVVVDESHHLYKDSTKRACIEKYATGAEGQRLILLSDVSQSLGDKIDYPDVDKEVTLEEVVRCSKRIVQAASSFQLGGAAKLSTRCHAESTGPPLRSFLFDLDAADGVSHPSEQDMYVTYTDHVLEALEHVTSSFPRLVLHNRVAILVPDDDFRDGLKPVLEQKLRAAASTDRFGPERQCAHGGFTLVNAHKAAAALVVGGQRQHREAAEELVLDTLANFDGLERLIVIAVALDAPLDQDADDMLETRSRLYRALTRAHMMALVVNEMVNGGWLEWLTTVRLQPDARFDREKEMRRANHDAPQQCVDARIAETRAAVHAALVKHKLQTDESLKLSEAEDRLIRERVNSAVQRHGKEMQAAAEAQLQSWSELREALRTAVRASASELSNDEETELLQKAQAAVRHGSSSDEAIASVLKEWHESAALVENVRRALSDLMPADGPQTGSAEEKSLVDACLKQVRSGVPFETAVPSQLSAWLVRLVLSEDADLSARERHEVADRILSEAAPKDVDRASVEAWVQATIAALANEKAKVRAAVEMSAADLSLTAVEKAKVEAVALATLRQGGGTGKDATALDVAVDDAVSAAVNAARTEKQRRVAALQEVQKYLHTELAERKLVLSAPERRMLQDEAVDGVLYGDADALEAVRMCLEQYEAAQVIEWQTVWDTSGNTTSRVARDGYTPLRQSQAEAVDGDDVAGGGDEVEEYESDLSEGNDEPVMTVGQPKRVAAKSAARPSISSFFGSRAAGAHTILLTRNNGPVKFNQPHHKGGYHIFLSHVWRYGQDQCATIKSMLQKMVPTASCFLDVDQLKPGDALEDIVRRCDCILVFLTKAYLLSSNCRRELRQAVAIGKPIVLLREMDVVHGAVLNVEELKDELEVPASGFRSGEREACEHLIDLFERGEGVEWYREKHLKHAALTQITQTAYAAHQGTREKEHMHMKEVRSADDFAGRTVLLSDRYRRLWPSNAAEAKAGLTMYDELERHFGWKGVGLNLKSYDDESGIAILLVLTPDFFHHEALVTDMSGLLKKHTPNAFIRLYSTQMPFDEYIYIAQSTTQGQELIALGLFDFVFDKWPLGEDMQRVAATEAIVRVFQPTSNSLLPFRSEYKRGAMISPAKRWAQRSPATARPTIGSFFGSRPVGRFETLKLTRSGEVVMFKVPTHPLGSHIYLSHVWRYGQDQCGTIKSMLRVMVPTASCFLDVDNLKSIQDLEDHVRRSDCIVIFLTRAYLLSRNCRCELRQAVQSKKPIVLVREMDMNHGAVLHADELRDELNAMLERDFKDGEREACEHLIGLFERGEGVEWYREKHLKHAALKHIVQHAYAAHYERTEREEMRMTSEARADAWKGTTVLLSDSYKRVRPSTIDTRPSKMCRNMYEELEWHFGEGGLGLNLKSYDEDADFAHKHCTTPVLLVLTPDILNNERFIEETITMLKKHDKSVIMPLYSCARPFADYLDQADITPAGRRLKILGFYDLFFHKWPMLAELQAVAAKNVVMNCVPRPATNAIKWARR